jgi:hypothetical protein
MFERYVRWDWNCEGITGRYAKFWTSARFESCAALKTIAHPPMNPKAPLTFTHFMYFNHTVAICCMRPIETCDPDGPDKRRETTARAKAGDSMKESKRWFAEFTIFLNIKSISLESYFYSETNEIYPEILPFWWTSLNPICEASADTLNSHSNIHWIFKHRSRLIGWTLLHPS